MKAKSQPIFMITAAAAMAVLILDSRCAAQSVRDSMELCLKTVIPSLFPMFVLSGLLVSGLTGRTLPMLRTLERFCRMPAGSGSLVLVGTLGGFPTGAVCIAQNVQQGALSRKDALRMMGFCNLCGPAFLFGVVPQCFASPAAAWRIFLIQLETALVIAHLWPGEPDHSGVIPGKPLTLPQAVGSACRAMVTVCAWIILAGVVTGFLRRWLFPLLPEMVGIFLTGMMELTGGCMALKGIASESLRLILCSGMVCFGGISVLLQIQGAVSDQGIAIRTCTAQKLAQAALGMGIAAASVQFGWVALLFPLHLAYLLKKAVEKPGKLLYNGFSKGGI